MIVSWWISAGTGSNDKITHNLYTILSKTWLIAYTPCTHIYLCRLSVFFMAISNSSSRANDGNMVNLNHKGRSVFQSLYNTPGLLPPNRSSSSSWIGLIRYSSPAGSRLAVRLNLNNSHSALYFISSRAAVEFTAEISWWGHAIAATTGETVSRYYNSLWYYDSWATSRQ
jgi:hypothetical protein